MPDNPFAFPRPGGVIAHPHDQFAPEPFSSYEGMTLRDYFAGQMMVGQISIAVAGGDEELRLMVAHRCYAMADAMLAAREKVTT